MDPISRAMHKFGDEAEAFWRAKPDALLPLVASDDQREEVVHALRLYEARPENRRPFVVFVAPFEATSTYFSALAVQIAEDFERVRAGAAEEGVELPAFTSGDDGTVPSGTLKRAVLAMHKAARLFGPRFDGIVVALVPDHIDDQAGWREAVRLLARTRWSRRVHLAVFASLGGPLCEVLEDEGVRFDLEPDAILAFLKDLSPAASGGPGPEPGAAGSVPVPPVERATDLGEQSERAPAPEWGEKFRGLLLRAAEALGAGRSVDAVATYREARALCQAGGLHEQEAALVIALAGACLAAKVPDLGADIYREAAVLAQRAEAWPLACQAWLGAGGAHLTRQDYAQGALAFRAAASAAKWAKVVPLQIEALRMAGTCLVHLGCEDDAMLVWNEAVDLGAGASATDRGASSFEEVGRALIALLERRGFTLQAQHVGALLECRKRATE